MVDIIMTDEQRLRQVVSEEVQSAIARHEESAHRPLFVAVDTLRASIEAAADSINRVEGHVSRIDRKEKNGGLKVHQDTERIKSIVADTIDEKKWSRKKVVFTTIATLLGSVIPALVAAWVAVNNAPMPTP